MAKGAVYGVTAMRSHDVRGCKGLEAAAPFRMGFSRHPRVGPHAVCSLKGGANTSGREKKKKKLKSSEALCLFEMGSGVPRLPSCYKHPQCSDSSFVKGS